MEIFISGFLWYTIIIVAARGQEFTNPSSSPTTLNEDESFMRMRHIYTFSTDDSQSAYIIESQDPDEHYFSIYGDALIAERPLDYESHSLFILEVSASFPAMAPSITATTTLTVIVGDVNETPYITNRVNNGGNVLFNESQPAGTVIDVDLQGHDPDNDALTWTIRSTTSFSIDANSGQITTTKVWDFENDNRINIFQAVVSDTGVPPLTSEYQIAVVLQDVNDNTPVFSPQSYSGTVAEKTGAGHSIIDLTATDGDASTTITMAVQSGDDASPKFIMSSTTLQTTSNQIDYSSLSSSDYKYILEITASDGVNTGTATVTISVTAVNPNAPVWSTFSPAYVDQTTPYYVDEGASVTNIVTVSATDSDSGLDGQVTYAIVGTPVSEDGTPVSGFFQLNGNTGVLSTSSALPDRDTDYEYFDITVRAEDQGTPSRFTDRVIRIGLTDVNDNTPVCTQSTFSGSIDENVATSSSVLTITATDSDATSMNNVITYTVTGGSGASIFSVSSSSGIISTSGSIDYEGVKNYDIEVTIEDNGSPSKSATCTAQITVNDKNDMVPTFPQNSLTVTISEATLIGTTLTTVLATDDDSSSNNNNQIIYSFVPTTIFFGIGSSSGIVTVIAGLDRESARNHTLIIHATDQGLPQNTGSMTLTVSLTDVNDNAPLISNTGPVSVSEAAAGGTTIFNVTATDADDVPNAMLSYSISSGNTNSRFSIDSGTGIVSIQNVLDRETLDSYQLKIKVSDSGTPSMSSTLTLDITVEDSNDNNPIFTSLPFVFSLIETSSIGSTVGTVQANDSDIGTNAQLTFSSMGADASYFSLHSATGVIVTTATFDREIKDEYKFTVTAEDGGTSPLTATANVTISITDANDNIPAFIHASYSGSTTENQPVGTSILSVTVTDDDIGMNSNIILSIDTSSGVGARANTFISVDSLTSILSVKQPINRESDPLFNFTLVATDQGNPALSSSVTVTVSVIDVNDNSPVFSLSSYSLNISEATSANSIIYSLSASDLDEGTNSVVSFSIHSFIRGNNTHFTINPFDGAIRSTVSLDRESENLYEIVVNASDGGSSPRSSTTTVTVSITDVNDNTPTFNQASYSGSTTENQPVGTSILSVTVTDDDIGMNSNILLSIDTSSAAGARADTFISVDSLTSILSVKQTIDRESDPLFNFTVVATDQGNPALSSSAEIYVTVDDQNDNSPTFQSSSPSWSVSESFSVNSILGIVFASDPDKGSNGDVTLDIQSFTPTDKAHFRLDPSIGTLISNATLDRETTDLYEIKIIASDGGSSPRSSTATVTVSVTDVNDNTPTFNQTGYSGSTTENQPIGTSILSVVVMDDDIGMNSNILLSIDTTSVAGARADTFISVDSLTSILSVKQTIDRENDPLFNFTVIATDQGNPALSSSVTVTVSVIDVNDNSPVFSLSSYSLNISEAASVGTIIGIVPATDSDEGSNSLVTYSFDSFLDGISTHFNISSSGAIRSSSSLDRETLDTYKIIVQAIDGGLGPHSSTTTVTISVTDYNDNPPIFSANTYEASLIENTVAAMSIVSVNLTDLDIGVNSDVILSIDTSTQSGARADQFISVNSTTSILSVKQSIDFETDQAFEFSLIATDQGTPALSSSAVINITVIDANDNEPIFTPSFISTEMSFDNECEVNLTTLSVSDADSGSNGDVTLAASKPYNSSVFFFNETSGFIEVINKTDRDNMYLIYIMASDGGSPSLNSSTEMIIRIDTFVPYDVILSYYMDINCSSYLLSESAFLSLLTGVFNESYLTCYAGRWCVSDGSNNASCIVHAYIIENDEADERSEINNTKQFLNADDAFLLATADFLGTPVDSLQGSAFVVTKVEKYNRTVLEDSSTPWIASGVGIAIVTSSSILGVIGVASAATRAGLNLTNTQLASSVTGNGGEQGLGGNIFSTTETGLQNTGNSSGDDMPRVSIAEEVNQGNTDDELTFNAGEQQNVGEQTNASGGARVVQVEPVSNA